MAFMDKDYVLSFEEVSKLSREEAAAKVGLKAWNIAILSKLVKEALETAKPPPSSDEPVLFISYRWTDTGHINWVSRFVKDLVRRGYKVKFDRNAQNEEVPLTVPELIARMVECNFFVPILTESYRRRIEGDQEGKNEDGWVFDEWQLALNMGISGRLKLCGIWRSGSSIPPPFTTESVCDFRDDKTYEYSLCRHFPTTRVHVVGIRSNNTGRMIGPLRRGNEAETSMKNLMETGEFVRVEMIEYIED